MKKTTLLIVVAMVVAILSSCKKEEEVQPIASGSDEPYKNEVIDTLGGVLDSCHRMSSLVAIGRGAFVQGYVLQNGEQKYISIMCVTVIELMYISSYDTIYRRKIVLPPPNNFKVVWKRENVNHPEDNPVYRTGWVYEP